MKTTRTSLFYFLFLGLFSLTIISCEDEEPVPQTTFYGPAVEIGNGTAKSVVQLNNAGEPEMIGIVFPESTLSINIKVIVTTS